MQPSIYIVIWKNLINGKQLTVLFSKVFYNIVHKSKAFLKERLHWCVIAVKKETTVKLSGC